MLHSIFPSIETQTAPAGLQAELAQQVRAWRARRGMTRRVLAQQSGLSERFLADVEAARGNASLQTVERIAAALNVAPLALFDGERVAPQQDAAVAPLLAPLTAARRERVLAELQNSVNKLLAKADKSASQKHRCIALIGLRGAGKSSLGARLAAQRQVPFIELDREIEREAGAALHEVLLSSGQAAFRQHELAALKRVLAEHNASGVVIATGGSLVSERATYQLLLAQCTTVWLKALPEEHMARVIAQGDMRPMHGNRAAMDDLQRILASRAADYGRADHTLDTAGRSVEASLAQLNSLLSTQNKGTP